MLIYRRDQIVRGVDSTSCARLRPADLVAFVA
jgi:hypothetical protein